MHQPTCTTHVYANIKPYRLDCMNLEDQVQNHTKANQMGKVLHNYVIDGTGITQVTTTKYRGLHTTIFA